MSQTNLLVFLVEELYDNQYIGRFELNYGGMYKGCVTRSLVKLIQNSSRLTWSVAIFLRQSLNLRSVKDKR